eukprot:57264_1
MHRCKKIINHGILSHMDESQENNTMEVLALTESTESKHISKAKILHIRIRKRNRKGVIYDSDSIETHTANIHHPEGTDTDNIHKAEETHTEISRTLCIITGNRSMLCVCYIQSWFGQFCFLY